MDKYQGSVWRKGEGGKKSWKCREIRKNVKKMNKNVKKWKIYRKWENSKMENGRTEKMGKIEYKNGKMG